VITALKTDRGLALQDLLAGAYEYIDTIEFPPAARVYLLDQLATTESVFLLVLLYGALLTITQVSPISRGK
jgi:hypothetical protein